MAARSASRSGAGRRVVGSSKADILIGLPASFSVPPLPSGTETSMLRAATWGWESACSTLLIGPAGVGALGITRGQLFVGFFLRRGPSLASGFAWGVFSSAMVFVSGWVP